MMLLFREQDWENTYWIGKCWSEEGAAIFSHEFYISLPSEWSSPLSQALAGKLSFGFLCWSQIHHVGSCAGRKSIQIAGYFLAPGDAFSMSEQPQWCSLKAQGWNTSLFTGKPFWLQNDSSVGAGGLSVVSTFPHAPEGVVMSSGMASEGHGAKAAWRRGSDGKVLCSQGGSYLEMLLI